MLKIDLSSALHLHVEIEFVMQEVCAVLSSRGTQTPWSQVVTEEESTFSLIFTTLNIEGLGEEGRFGTVLSGLDLSLQAPVGKT